MIQNIFFNDKLELEINLIGYKSIGECIVFFVKTDGIVAYTGLVDCYRTSNANVIIDLMKKENIDYFNFVCWTHPHDDHTIGMDDIIKEHCNKDTKFWMPPLLKPETDDFARQVQGTYNELFKILRLQGKTNMKIKENSDAKILEKFLCRGNTAADSYKFQIMSFAPDSNLLLKKMIKEIYNVGNLYSIGLILNFGHFYIVLAGDLENVVIDSLPDYNFWEMERFDYLKIPHHASKTSASLISKFNKLGIGAPSIATTTVYRTHNLPDEEIIKKYCTWGNGIEVYITEDCINSGSKKVEYGIISTNIDILDKREYPIETKLVGNAILVDNI